MGGRGSGSGNLKTGGSSIALSNKIKSEMLQHGINSKFKGVQRDAKAGEGNYSYKNAKAINESVALKMDVIRMQERDGNTLVEGMNNGRHVFYANRTSDRVIQTIKNNEAKKKEKQVQESGERRLEIRTTTTYDRWKKTNAKKFSAWFSGGR